LTRRGSDAAKQYPADTLIDTSVDTENAGGKLRCNAASQG
jgi:hypothetical protein